jgi:cysteine desulfurase
MEPSHVLRAMGLSRERALGSVRFSFSRMNTDAEVDRVLAVLPGVIRRLQEAPMTPEELRALKV